MGADDRSANSAHGPLLPHAQPLPGESGTSLYRGLSPRHRLVNGMFERRDGHIHNTTSVIDPQGTVIGRPQVLSVPALRAGRDAGEAFLYWDVPGVGHFWR